MSTAHSGAHVDALAHMTIGPDARWYGGGNAGDHLGDFGPAHGDAAMLPSFFARGVLLDVAGRRGVKCLPQGLPITADELDATARAQGTELPMGCRADQDRLPVAVARCGADARAPGAWA